MSAAELLVSKLNKVRRTGNGTWIACCPAHEDKHPSFTVKECEDGRLLLHCFAACSIEDILRATGLHYRDIMPPEPLGQRIKPIRRPFPAADVLECLRTEAMIVWLAGCDMATGKTLTKAERDRLNVAATRIEDATYAGL